jgi:hypothetical protein
LSKQIKGFTIDGLQQLFALVLPFELGDSDLLGDVFQLVLGFIALGLESEGVTLVVARRRERVARSRGVARQGWICGRCGSRVTLDEAENAKRIVSDKKKISREL